MEKHILICGERGVGKSTLIRRLLAESTLPVGGFVTRRLTQADGDGMFPIYLHAAALPPEERPYDPEHLVGTCDSRRSIRYPEAFDRLGPPLLTSGGLLVMDELGFLENDAHLFQAAVCSRKSWTAERFSLSRAMAISSLRRSTAPPPMVPVSRPLAPTSIWEPLFRGALPAVSISVTSTVSRCFSIS